MVLIGELARRTGVSERLLRYYERTQLIHAERRANGYREYDDQTVETVRRVRALLAVGLPTRVIRQVLPCTHDSTMLRPCPGVLTSLREQLEILDQRAAELENARRLLRQTIAATEDTEDAAGRTPTPGTGIPSSR
nr:MerR family transcriptional regulator [Streptomyces sp. SID486]